jgi:uncharacterized protein (TIGR02001 family)
MILGRETFLRGLAPAVAVAMLAATGVAKAAEPAAPGGGGHEWDLLFGATITSDYVSRGESLSDGPAFQPWAELDIGKFYVGYWGSNVVGDWEHDLSIGVRPEVGPFSFDFGYVRYIYNSGDCCGELYAKASVSPVDPLTLGALIYYDPDASTTYVEGNAAYSLMHDITLSGAVGHSTYSGLTSWNAGASWQPLGWLKLDARYYGSDVLNEFVFSAGFSTSLKMLKGG